MSVPAVQQHLSPSQLQPRLRDVDYHFAATLERIEGGEQPELRLAAMLVSALAGEGHICVDLSDHAGRRLFADAPRLRGDQLAPAFEPWCQALLALEVVGEPGATTPLILDPDGRLYLGRYWALEAELASALLARLATPVEALDLPAARALLERLFVSEQQPDWQRVAAALALRSAFCLISGGPGTGKTTTVTKLLALLQDQALRLRGKALRIALAAPTGKAAARLGEAIGQATAGLDGLLPAALLSTIPVQATTLHRLLGARPGSIGFAHNAENPLHLDLLLVDEASMVDLPLMSRLLAAVPPGARVILLGDRDQLASVEAGSVLGDICAPLDRLPGYGPDCQQHLQALGCGELAVSEQSHPLRDALVQLRHSYRFAAASAIGQLARAINAGDAEQVQQVLEQSAADELGWRELAPAELASALAELAVPGYRAAMSSSDPLQALAAFDELRILCALRDGPFGVVEVNRLVEQALARAGLIEPHSRWYAGRPILIRRNDPRLGLANGDIGILLPDPQAGGRLRAFFRTPEGELRGLLPERLPEHESVFAMTVHKSQGSEFNHCLLILPEQHSPLVTRELLYTAITRARQRIEIWGGAAQIAQAVTRRVERVSGLERALWQGEESGLPEV